MSEERWMLGIRVKDYIDAIMLRREEAEKRISEEGGEELFRPSPLIKVTGKPYGVKIKCGSQSVKNVLDILLSANNIVVEEIYVKNYNERYIISAIIYAEKTIDLWKIVDKLVGIKEINDVKIMKPLPENNILPNPWLFPVRINGLILSLIPNTIICTIDEKNSIEYASRIAESLFADLRGKIDSYLVPIILKTFGFGKIIDEKVDDKVYSFKISCQNDLISDGYCTFIKVLITELTGKKDIKIVKDKGSCIICINRE